MLWINFEMTLIRRWKWIKIRCKFFIVTQCWYKVGPQRWNNVGDRRWNNVGARRWNNVETKSHNVETMLHNVDTTLYQHCFHVGSALLKLYRNQSGYWIWVVDRSITFILLNRQYFSQYVTNWTINSCICFNTHW